VGEVELERLGLVPADVREYVLDRDQHACRICGKYVTEPALHHVKYKSQGGLDVPSNLVTIGWRFGHDCHLGVAHRNKRLWQPILLAIAEDYPGVTALQWRRWNE
jgi:5-methylcytosine-specific restriction endonuclease McrA